MPTKQTEENPRARKISHEGAPKRFIGDASKQDHGFGHRNNREWKKEEKPVAEKVVPAPVAEKPVVAKTTADDEWSTVKDVAKEKKLAEDAKRKADKALKEKEQEKKAQEAKVAQAAEKAAQKKVVHNNFADGW